MDEYIKKSEAVDVIVKYPYNIAGKTATAIKMIYRVLMLCRELGWRNWYKMVQDWYKKMKP